MIRPPEKVPLLQILEAAKGPVGEAKCLLGQRACDVAECLLCELVVAAHDQKRKFLRQTTLDQLARRFTLGATKG
jgi:DNA-binding IscR family transcriptional regulator